LNGFVISWTRANYFEWLMDTRGTRFCEQQRAYLSVNEESVD